MCIYMTCIGACVCVIQFVYRFVDEHVFVCLLVPKCVRICVYRKVHEIVYTYIRMCECVFCVLMEVKLTSVMIVTDACVLCGFLLVLLKSL